MLLNPLVYMCEGFRAALTQGVDHMALPYVYGALLAFAVVFTTIRMLRIRTTCDHVVPAIATRRRLGKRRPAAPFR